MYMTKMGVDKFVYIGVDIGSTTTKLVVIRPQNRKIIYKDYQRHYAKQAESVEKILRDFANEFPDCKVCVCFTGSGAKVLAEGIHVPFVQEVAANAIAMKSNYNNVGTAIELGGQDAKIIFFHYDEQKNKNDVVDMRMNGSCAGGTGAFIDEIATLLQVPVEEFDELASRGNCVYDISGRCGVYAKTDIQPLLNQGASKEDIALSTFHAIAKQTIGGLAQGLDIKAPVAMAGGPLAFNKTLRQVFKARLNLSDEELLVPEHPEYMIAYGAACYAADLSEHEFFLCNVNDVIEKIRDHYETNLKSNDNEVSKVFFESDELQKAFVARHKLPEHVWTPPQQGQIVKAYLGIDSGSTTTKFALIDENENLLDYFYAPNEGSPLMVAKNALIGVREKYKKAGTELEIVAAGTTGYGELLFHSAFDTEYHVVETVAHARAASKYVEDVSFILDIGGQDMKAIWVEQGIVTNILVNEACSSGCGSFLENFASTLNIETNKIADAAFASKNPANLGSRCTVFMNSSVITEQRNGKTPEDIMAGLCRSIIENVFTKVIRISNVDSLGEKIVVQGGTFRNDAVLRAMEQYIGKTVIRAPYPEIMGAIGVALLTKEKYGKEIKKQTFIGLDNLDDFSYKQEANVTCPFCMNHCKRTIVSFSNGKTWITNNRCEKGEILGNPGDGAVGEQIKRVQTRKQKIPNMFQKREELLFSDYSYTQLLDKKNVQVGLPRVLSFWETMPFWKTFWRSLGFQVVISDRTTRESYESGLSAVTSDTICFPAKIVHGHLRNLAEKKVDFIFMPSITTVPSENTEETSQSMCAVVKGYPIVIRNSDNPEKQYQIPFEAPLFHWYSDADRKQQLSEYMKKQFDIPPNVTSEAIKMGDRAQESFQRKLKDEGSKIINEVEKQNSFAVVLAARPYHNDALVNHELPEMFTRLGIPVLTADSLPEAEKMDLSRSRIDIVNNYHARMLSSAMITAKHRNLEYVQLVSFGCGHDAYLSDEIVRVMNEISGKVPLILKVDESDIQGPLRIRVRSFVETISKKREVNTEPVVRELTDPYPIKFTKKCRKEKVVLVPNTSHAFCRIMSAALKGQGIKAVPLRIGREDAIKYGKQYVHNDICFPAQIVIGEALSVLKCGEYDSHNVAIAMGKYIGDCRLTHYSALLRKALDDAGFSHVPILTNDDVDYHNMHPGFKMSLMSAMRIAFTLPMIDVLEELLRKIRPYEVVRGSADRAFERALDVLVKGLEEQGIYGVKKGFEKAINIMKQIPYIREEPKPTVLIVGEYLLNFHPGANHDIELYLEKHGFEVIQARMTDVIRKTYFYQDTQNKEYHLHRSIDKKVWFHVANNIFNLAHDVTDKIAQKHPLYEKACRMQDLVKDSDPIIHHTFDAGEGVLIPGEILHHAKKGCRTFIILQPFGCLPNHVVGRGISKKIKELYPDAQILPLDYDPDVSFANIENRLQMLMMSKT